MPSGKILLYGYSKNKGLSQGIILLADEDLNTKLLYMDERMKIHYSRIEVGRSNLRLRTGSSKLVVKKFSPKGIHQPALFD